MQLPFMIIAAIALGVYDNDMIPVIFKSLAMWFAMTIGVVLVKQSNLLYVPFPDPRLPKLSKHNPPGYKSPDEACYKMKYLNLRLETVDGAFIHSWFIKAKDPNADATSTSTSTTTANPGANNENRNEDSENGKESFAPEKAPTIIYFHGNAGSIAHRLPLYFEFYNKLAPVNILAVEYRGYGESDDSFQPSEAGIKLDAQAALHWALSHPEHVDPTKIFLFGCSLGGAVAIALASSPFSKRLKSGNSNEDDINNNTVENSESGEDDPSIYESRIRGVILENTFTSIKDLAMILLPYLRPISFLIRPPLLLNAWASLDSISSCGTPILFISGELDELVPPSHMSALHEKSIGTSPLVMFERIAGGGHNTTPLVGGEAYYSKIKVFMEKVLGNEFDAKQDEDPVKTVADDIAAALNEEVNEDYEFVNKEE